MGYRAPEMVKADPTAKKGYNSKTDIWALGCILYELLIGKRPFDDDFNVLQHSQTVQNLSIPQCGLVDKYWSTELSNLLNNMLGIQPQKRKSALDMLKRFAFHYELQMREDRATLIFELPRMRPIYQRVLDPWLDSKFAVGSSKFALLDFDITKIWDPRQGMYNHTLEAPNNELFICLAFSKGIISDKELLATVHPTTLLLWDFETCTIVGDYEFDEVNLPRCLAFNYSGNRIAYGTNLGAIHFLHLQVSDAYLYSLSYFNLLYQTRPHSSFVILDLQYHPDDSFLLVLQPSLLSIWDTQEGTLIVAHEFTQSWNRNIAVHPLRHEVLLSSSGYNRKIGLTHETWKTTIIDEHMHGYFSYSPCGDYLLSSHASPARVLVWKSKSHELLHWISKIGGGPLWFLPLGEKNICLVFSTNLATLYCINLDEERKHYGF